MTVDFSNLAAYLNALSRDEQIDFARKCHTTIGYMRKRISLKRAFGFEIANEIAARGIMKPHELRPKDYQNFVWKQNHE